MSELNPFLDVKANPVNPSGDLHGSEVLDNIAKMQIGSGSRAFKADESGIWLGANSFADAPFSVDMQGNITATSLDLSGYLTKTGTSQPLTGDIRVGSAANVKIDGANARIIINDGTNDRILIGYQSGGF